MKKGLGRGLADLQADIMSVESGAEIPVLTEKNRVLVKQLNLDEISPNPDQPRKTFNKEELQELSDSIREKGVLQAILVRQVDKDNYKYEIIAGERRWRASKLAGLSEIPAIVRSVSDNNAMEIAIIENIQREDLNAVDESMAYFSLMNKCDYSIDDLNKILGKSVSYIRNSLRLIKLPESVREMVKNNLLSAGHARAIVVVDETNVEDVAKQIIDKNMSVREAEILIKSKPRSAERSAKKAGISLEERKKIEQGIKLSTGIKANISVNASGSGVLKLYFNNKTERHHLENLLTNVE